MELVYYPDHAERHPGLADWQRAEYPDEVRFGPLNKFVIRREKNLADITPEDVRNNGADTVLLMAKDVPISKCYY